MDTNQFEKHAFVIVIISILFKNNVSIRGFGTYIIKVINALNI